VEAAKGSRRSLSFAIVAFHNEQKAFWSQLVDRSYLGLRLRYVSQSSFVQSKTEAPVIWLRSLPCPTR
jgi:hypothetical protein